MTTLDRELPTTAPSPGAQPWTIPAPLLVTGATGNVGRAVVRIARERGLPVWAGVRQAREADALGEGVRGVELDLTRPETFARAVAGARSIFLMRPPAISDVASTLNVLVDRAAEAGVDQIVLLSVTGADRQPWLPHHKAEQHLRRSRVPWTFLRPAFFAQNLGDAYREDIRRDDRIFVPAGEGRVAFVDVRDVAEVAVGVLGYPAARGAAYTLTGAEAVSFDEVAAVLTRALGREIRYQPATVLEYAWRLHRRGMRPAQIGVQAVLHWALRYGGGAKIDPTLERLLGRRPRTVADYVADHVELWRAAA